MPKRRERKEIMQANDTYLKMLYEAEKAIQGVNELAEIEGKVKPEYERCKEELDKVKSNKKKSIPLILVLLGVTVLLFLGSAAGINKAVVLRNFCRFLLAVAVFLDIATLSDIITAPGKIKRAEDALAKAEKAVADYEKLFQAKTKDLSVGIQLWKAMMPQECIVPKYARKYISFFEHGQAATEAEARNLFDMFLHREKMEKMVAEQLASVQASNAAVLSAVNRAADAANAAASATRDLNQTANYIRSK